MYVGFSIHLDDVQNVLYFYLYHELSRYGIGRRYRIVS